MDLDATDSFPDLRPLFGSIVSFLVHSLFASRLGPSSFKLQVLNGIPHPREEPLPWLRYLASPSCSSLTITPAVTSPFVMGWRCRKRTGRYRGKGRVTHSQRELLRSRYSKVLFTRFANVLFDILPHAHNPRYLGGRVSTMLQSFSANRSSEAHWMCAASACIDPSAHLAKR